MKKTAVIFLVLLTACSLGLTFVPGVHSQASSVKVTNYSYYVDSNGFLVVVGQVQNIGANTVDPIWVTGTATTRDGTQVPSYARAWVTDLTPQQKAPFYMEFYPPQGSNFWDPTNIAKIELTVSVANATSNYQYPDLTITSSHGAVGTSGNFTGAYVVNGEIKNSGSQAASNLTVVGTFFNSTGAVVGVGYTEFLTPATLEPSASLSFQVAAFDLNQSIVPDNLKITSYELLVQTQSPILQGTAPIATPYATAGATQTSTATPSTPSNGQGSQSNSNPPAISQTTLISAAVIVVVIVAVAAFFLSIRRRGKSEPEVESKPAKTKKQPPKPSRRRNR